MYRNHHTKLAVSRYYSCWDRDVHTDKIGLIKGYKEKVPEHMYILYKLYWSKRKSSARNKWQSSGKNSYSSPALLVCPFRLTTTPFWGIIPLHKAPTASFPFRFRATFAIGSRVELSHRLEARNTGKASSNCKISWFPFISLAFRSSIATI